VGDGDPIPDPGGQHLLPLQHGGEEWLDIGPGPLGEERGQFAKDAGLIGGREGHLDAFWGQELGEQQSGIWHEIEVT
jgi:hypothetical protein